MVGSDVAIRSSGLGKCFRLHHELTSSYDSMRDLISGRLKDWGKLLRSPRSRYSGSGPVEVSLRSVDEEFWALRDVSFEICRGDRVGVIGRNGAGKSTLLKVLSRITEPTTGRVEIYGRVASLLEVGTGFHPELTGRENIFLNGAILGLSRRQVRNRFDEIVEFSEISRFLDTPVKRYSSGMYVRLAFAVAASLDSDILIVDEVLAVGDARFQQKCLGRMGEISRDGRTVLLVSHNMGAIHGLCDSALLLNQGQLQFQGTVGEAIARYLADNQVQSGSCDLTACPWAPDRSIRFLAARIRNVAGAITGQLACTDAFIIEVEYEVIQPLTGLRIGFHLRNEQYVTVCGSNALVAGAGSVLPGCYRSVCHFPGHLLNQGEYTLYFGADAYPYEQSLITTEECLKFTMEDMQGHGPMRERMPGVLRPELTWGVTTAHE